MPILKEHEINLTYDSPIEYKELKIYPVKVKDYFYFYSYVGCLLLEKNSIPDINIIQMSYLDYMYKISLEEKKMYVLMFTGLMALCLNIEIKDIVAKYDSKSKPTFVINDVVYDSKDFDEVKSIICEQNLVDLPDETISKEIRDKIQEARELKERLEGNSNDTASIEDLIVSISVSTGMPPESIYEFTIRKFNKMIQRLDAKLHYEIYLSASMSGLVEFKDKSFIKHWLSNLDVDKDAAYKLDYDAVKGKVSFEDKK